MDLSFEALRSDYDAKWARFMAANVGMGDANPPNHGGFTNIHETWTEAQAIVAPAAKGRYQRVEALTGVPWFVTGIVHTREAGSPPNFHAWLHNGDPMFDHNGHPRQTVDVPAHRPLNPACSWEIGCTDAYQIEGLLNKRDWSAAFVAWFLEKMNGFGYREWHRIPSPYLWGSTVIQRTGKYVRDRQYDPNVMDTQVGGMALLAALMQIAPSEVKFAPILADPGLAGGDVGATRA